MNCLLARQHLGVASAACGGRTRSGQLCKVAALKPTSSSSLHRRQRFHEHGGVESPTSTSSSSSSSLTATAATAVVAAAAAVAAPAASSSSPAAVLQRTSSSPASTSSLSLAAKQRLHEQHRQHQDQSQQPAVVSGSSVMAAHAALFRTPLTAPLLQPSHTSIDMPLAATSLYGNYELHGPAVLRVVRDGLLAYVQPGGVVSVLESPSQGPTTMSSATLSHDEQSPALCHLVGRHLELDGAFVLPAAAAASTCEDGSSGGGSAATLPPSSASAFSSHKTILSVSRLPEGSCITLLAGGSISHPVNVHPTRGRPRAA